MDPVNQDWATLKHHFGAAYEIYITPGNVGNNPYVGRANNAEIIDEEDNDSVLTITNVVGNMQMASNAQSQAIQEDVTELRREIGFLRAEISTRNQGAANNSQAALLPQWAPMPSYVTAPPPPLAPPQPPQAAYNAIPPPLPQTAFNAIPPPTNACRPPTQQRQQGIGRGGRGAGRGRTRGCSRCSIGMSAQPPMAGTGQNHTGTGQTRAPSIYNFFNNWGICFSCGFDVPGWHTSRH